MHGNMKIVKNQDSESGYGWTKWLIWLASVHQYHCERYSHMFCIRCNSNQVILRLSCRHTLSHTHTATELVVFNVANSNRLLRWTIKLFRFVALSLSLSHSHLAVSQSMCSFHKHCKCLGFLRAQLFHYNVCPLVFGKARRLIYRATAIAAVCYVPFLIHSFSSIALFVPVYLLIRCI